MYRTNTPATTRLAVPAPRRVLAGVGIASLALAACGGDDDESLTEDQQFVVDDTTTAMAEFGVLLDESCVNGVAARIPEDDARLYVESEGEADGFSPEFQALGDELQGCVDDVSGLIDQLVGEAEEFEGFFDPECLREVYEGAEPTQVMASLSEPDVLDTTACEL